ncbi:MAG TPA: Flp family type IVb pilin, partial [Clostridiales bacterium]|nr:Flp family type IVb pilin [Clostridiales bacterium]
MKKLVNFFKDENGQGMVEYGLIIGLIAIVVIAGLV